jgi:hypothetical protein
MMHDEGWRVMRLGRRIERMHFVASILMRQLESPHATRPEAVEWLLDVCDSTPIYRARYLGALRLSQMLNLLLYDDGHPMALVFHRRSIDRDLDELARSLAASASAACPTCRCCRRVARAARCRGRGGRSARAELAAELHALAARTAELSDRCRAATSRSSNPTRTRSRPDRHEPQIPRPSRDQLPVRRRRGALASPAAPGAAADAYQECSSTSSDQPGSHRRVNELDAFGNPLIRIELAQPHRELTVVSQMQIEVHARPRCPRDHRALGEGARLVRVSRRLAIARSARCGALPSRIAARALKQSFTDYSAMCFPKAADPRLRGSAEHEAARGHQYVPGVTTVSTSPTEVSRRGAASARTSRTS